MLINRRNALRASSAAAAFFASGAATAATAKKIKGDVELRGTVGRLERIGSMELEHQQDFLTTYRGFVNDELRKVAAVRAEAVIKAAGLNPKAELNYAEAAKLFEQDPILQQSVKSWIVNQQLTWSTIQDYFHRNADMYLAEMDAFDKAGPGTLEWDPKLAIPDYAKHEIHIQPGGYVGDPFAGYINFYGVNNFYAGKNYQDETQMAIVQTLIPPKDGKVKRILDLGCATGRLTMQLKERFPDAEVWGIDVGAPMVRFAHLRAADLGTDIHYAQRLAEDTKFPDGYFDVVTSYIIMHEVTLPALQKITAEAMRVLRPGGVYYPVDFATGKQRMPMTAYAAYSIWWDHRWNNEVWSLDYRNNDYSQYMKDAGFVTEDVKPARRGHGGLLGTKT